MDIRTLFCPTRIIIGDDCVALNGDMFVNIGSKPLIVTGRKSSMINGSLKEVERIFETAGKDYIVFNEVEENPSVETVVKAADIGKANNVDYIVAIGGGSAIDAAKAVAVLVANPSKCADDLNGKEQLNYLPILAIPTTAGTGSEVTPFSILTYHKERTKRSVAQLIYPMIAFLDSKYLVTQSYEGTVSAAADTLCHLVESYLNTNSNEHNRIYSREGMRVFAKCKKALLTNDFTKEDYDNMLYASTLGGLSITHTKTSLPHGLSYMVTYETGEAHGRACGRFLGEFVKMYEREDSETVHKVMELLEFRGTDEFVSFLDELLKLPKLPEGLYESTWKALMNNPAKLKNYPFKLEGIVNE